MFHILMDRVTEIGIEPCYQESALLSGQTCISMWISLLFMYL